jgi:hypothetical protein
VTNGKESTIRLAGKKLEIDCPKLDKIENVVPKDKALLKEHDFPQITLNIL